MQTGIKRNDLGLKGVALPWRLTMHLAKVRMRCYSLEISLNGYIRWLGRTYLLCIRLIRLSEI